MPHTFTDAKGRDWSVAVNVASIKRTKELAQLDLMAVVAGDGQVMQRLANDPITLANVLFALCKPQADERKITDEDFGEALAGDVIDKASEALLADLVAFFPPGKRKLMAAALAKLNAHETAREAAAMRRLESNDLSAALKAELDADDERFCALLKKYGSLSTSSPASSA